MYDSLSADDQTLAGTITVTQAGILKGVDYTDLDKLKSLFPDAKSVTITGRE